MMNIDLDPDARHYPRRTRDLADLASQAVRTLNYATQKQQGMIYPGDAYSLLGELGLMAGRFPQLFEQIGDFLEREEAASHLYVRNGSSAQAVAKAGVHLREAMQAAQSMHIALKAAQSAINALDYDGPGVNMPEDEL